MKIINHPPLYQGQPSEEGISRRSTKPCLIQHGLVDKNSRKVVRVEHQGERDFIRHMNTESHKKNAEMQKTNAKLNFAPAKSAVDEKVSKI